ncbi:hypothetical protein FGO68_gene9616 [Halteria grandinella]|uniref:Uncharacterized protein n=1 Tax=Halteria grandinella TaxID=5974 RepID=A0A8J8NP83_HALGN|nr:hypothetical protein FGO68_gene9616 [Halteria grandinella]
MKIKLSIVAIAFLAVTVHCENLEQQYKDIISNLDNALSTIAYDRDQTSSYWGDGNLRDRQTSVYRQVSTAKSIINNIKESGVVDDEALLRCQQEKVALTSQKGQCDTKVIDLTQTKNDLENAKSKCEAQVNDLKNASDILQATNSQCLANLELVQKEKAQIESEKNSQIYDLKSQIQEKDSEIQCLESTINMAQSELHDSIKDLEQANNSISTLKSEIAVLEIQISNFTDEIQLMKEEATSQGLIIDDLKYSQVQSIENIEELNSKLVVLQSHLNATTQTLAKVSLNYGTQLDLIQKQNYDLQANLTQSKLSDQGTTEELIKALNYIEFAHYVIFFLGAFIIGISAYFICIHRRFLKSKVNNGDYVPATSINQLGNPTLA